MAPSEWQDREKLWNAVEEAEKTKDSRLAREFVAALPIELSRQQQIELLQDFIREQFVDEGMCADVAIHDTDGHNPHAHILLTVRPLTESGAWQYKTEKEYLCVKDGEERGFTTSEFKAAQAEGWEKQYSYKVGKKKVYMAPSAAQAHGYVRADKHPKSTRYGRQNPISARWNSEEQLLVWREAWATAANRCLELAGHDSRIDHRSHAERGLEELRSEKALLLQQFEYAEDAGAETFRKDIAVLESNLQKLDEQEQKYSAELDAALHEYAEAKSQAADLDPVELYEARQAIRPRYEVAANEKLEQVFGSKYSPLRWMDAKQAQTRLTNDTAEEYAAIQVAKQRHKSMSLPTRKRKQEQEW